jgi:hypothetical protein
MRKALAVLAVAGILGAATMLGGCGSKKATTPDANTNVTPKAPGEVLKSKPASQGAAEGKIPAAKMGGKAGG